MTYQITTKAQNSQTRTHSVESRLAQYGATVDARLKPDFDAAKISYPPTSLAFIVIKDQRILQLYAANKDNRYVFIRSYPILAASGKLGPKLREGDLQVPEGIYKVQLLNPNSSYHLSLRVNYPNDFDRLKGAEDKRFPLGGDIMIHGSNLSVGCVALGDPASEDLFVLAARTGIQNISLLFSPTDFRVHPEFKAPDDTPAWTNGLYQQIKDAFRRYPQQTVQSAPQK